VDVRLHFDVDSTGNMFVDARLHIDVVSLTCNPRAFLAVQAACKMVGTRQFGLWRSSSIFLTITGKIHGIIFVDRDTYFSTDHRLIVFSLLFYHLNDRRRIK